MFRDFRVSDIEGEDQEEFIQLINPEEDQGSDEDLPEKLGILPLKNTVLFPGVIIPITVGRKKSIRLVKRH